MEMQQFFPFADPKISYSVQDDSLWKDKWKDSFHPFRVSDDLIVTPVWEAHPDIATAKDTLLLIEPGSAFGTGTHETTRLCMTSLKKYISPETTILDAGCGSGILITFLILCGIVAVIFFLLPTFIVFAAVGAIVLFIMRLFMGF